MMLANPAFSAVALLSAFFVGLSKGGLPLIAILSVPLFSLFISPVTAAALLLPIYIATDIVGLWIYRGIFSGRNLAILTPSAIAGVGVGWATASFIQEWVITLIVGLLGLLYCFNTWRKLGKFVPPRPADVPRGVFWGMISGFTSFVSHSGGPPYQIYVLPQRLDKLVFAGTTAILFAIVNAVKVLPYWALGQFDRNNLSAALALVPVAIIGTFIGARLLRMIRDDIFFRCVEIALLIISLKLIWDALKG
ncbi:membrane protein [Rhizobium sp. LC145]|nr:membrane protein [Rhizobium sp. LC145]